MGNFNNNRPDRGRPGDNRGFQRSQMNQAICSKCGKSCLVPFKPSGNRPIFCSDCFRNEGGSSIRRTDVKTLQTSSDRPMYDATCDKCGNRCQIPFQPRSGKKVFCSHCFEQKEKGDRDIQEKPHHNEQFDMFNVKLDKILELLNHAAVVVDNSKRMDLEKKDLEEIKMPKVKNTEKKDTSENLLKTKKYPSIKNKAASKKKSQTTNKT